MAARAAVFVVEQNCAYQDADFADFACFHLAAWLPIDEACPVRAGDALAEQRGANRTDANRTDANRACVKPESAERELTKQALAAYVRLVPPGLKFAEASIGRVLTSPIARRQHLGAILMTRAIAQCHALFGLSPIRIGAQKYLEHFYQRMGFITVSDVYDEDGIPHIEMLRPAVAVA